MIKSKRYLIAGIILNSISIVLIRIDGIPEFIRGLCLGLALTFIFMGSYYQNHDTPKFIQNKQNMLKN